MFKMKRRYSAATLLLLFLMIAVPAIAGDAGETVGDSLPAPSGLSEVVVTGSRGAADVRHLPMTVTTIGREQLTANARSSILPTVMEEVPGVVVTSRGVLGYGVSTGGSGSLNMRGLSSGAGQMLFLIDGHPQYQGIFGHGIADSYQTMVAERVEVLRGPASLLYGSNAMGGVVNIVTRRLEPSATAGKLLQHTTLNAGAGSYGTVQVEGANQMRVGRLTTTAAAQYQRSDNHRPNMGFEQYGGCLNLGYKLSDHWDVTAMADITHFNTSNPGTVTVPMTDNDQRITRGSANLVLANSYDRTSGALSVYNNYGNHSIDDGYKAQGGKPQTDLFRSRDAVTGVSWYQNVLIMDKSSVTFGVDYQHVYGHAWYVSRQTGATVTTKQRLMQSANIAKDEVAGYVNVNHELNRYLNFNAGVRYDYHTQAGDEWIPQLGLVARPVSTGEFKFLFSKGFRNPTGKDMYLYGMANDSLRAESMLNYEVSWHQRLLGGRLSYGVNLFLIDGENMIVSVPMKNAQTGMQVCNQNTGEFRNKGFEVEAAWRINTHWRLTTNHSYLHMSKHLVGAAPYKGYVGASCQYGRFSATAGLQQLVGLYTQADGEEVQENATLLHMTLGYRLCPLLKVWAKGDNLLGQRYEINAGYPMPKATFMGGITLDI